jgi:hypothetical protein
MPAMSITPILKLVGALVALSGFVAACGRTRAAEETALGPRLGESTAMAPNNPNVAPPDATGPSELSVPLAHPPTGPAPTPPPTPEVPEQPITPPMQPPPPTDGGSPGVFAPPPTNP